MMVIVKIMGGLGNQMFQYAAGRALSQRLKAELKLDISWFETMDDAAPRMFLLHCFAIAATEATTDEINKIIFEKQNICQKALRIKKKYSSSYKIQPSYDYWLDFSSFTPPVYLSGYWQNEKYFSDILPIIIQDFSFPKLSCSNAVKMSEKIKLSSNSVSIHIRRGDYVENPDVNRVHGTCHLEYYKKALQIIAGNYNKPLELYIFSDDPDWVRNHFDMQEYPSVIVDVQEHKNAPYNDMHLMSLCNNHIIANSSFSWWAAWLSAGDGVVIAPKRWFAENSRRHHNPSIPSWVTI